MGLGMSENSWMTNGVPAYYPGKVSHGVNDALSHKILAELDRSIHKHLEKGKHGIYRDNICAITIWG